ncbi:unnamed protein product [Bemisia tabaci]|uniref:Cytochrome P450 n=2 Tax=Bemisia tabaci TaxID=7038 RepID=A0A9P0A2Z6_BEMTA|nr:unnamed protein product [Bemisia tabaci]
MVFHLLLALLLIVLISFVYIDSRRPPNFPPGPKWLPVIGNLYAVQKRLAKMKFLHLVFTELAEKYGPVVGLRLGLFRVIIVSDYDSIRQVLTKDEFVGRPQGFIFRLRSFGKRHGLVFTDGPVWMEQRRFCLKYLRETGMGKPRMDHLIGIEAAEVVQALRIKMQTHGFVSVRNFFDVAVLNVLWTMVAGQRFHIEDQRLSKLLNLLHQLFRLVDTSGGVLNQLPMLRHVAPEKSGYRQFKSILDQIHAFLKESVDEHRENLSSNMYEANDLMSAYIRQIESNNETSKSTANPSEFSEEQLLVILLDLFMAGSETTSTTLDFIILYLVRFPECQKRAHDQLFSVTGFNREPTLKDRPSLCYIDAFISEVQRHGNNVPLGVSHRAVEDTNLNGFTIPKDSVVFTNLYRMNMDKHFWGDPHEFRPERFLNSSGQLSNHERFMPFGLGPRRCLGESLARGTLFVFVASILNNFVITLPTDQEPPTLTGVDGITLTIQPFKAVFTLHH